MSTFKVVLYLLIGGVIVTRQLNNILGFLSYVIDRMTGDPPVPVANKVVLPPWARITATTSEGTISISSEKGLKRSFTWDGVTKSVVMWPRGSRWYGSMGLYFPGPGYHWLSHNGIRRCTADEGQQHFNSLDEAVAWIKKRTWMSHVYNDDGLVVGWGKNLARSQLSVDVWQIYIEGKKPDKLPGSENDKIATEKVDRVNAT